LSSSRKKYNVAIPLELINLSSTYFTYREVEIEQNRVRSPSDIFSLGTNSSEVRGDLKTGLSEALLENGANITVDDLPVLSLGGKTKSMNLPAVEKKTKKEKFYLLDGIKNHILFKDIKFWEACLLYQMSTNREGFDFHDVHHSIAESVVTENYISKITNTFMSIAMHMKDVSISTSSIIQMLSKYAMKYRIPTKSFESLQSFLDLTFKSDDPNKSTITGVD
jgi:hypothetical protein